MSQPADPRISFIIPAYNEEAVLDGTLAALFAAARGAGEPFEVIVVDDASTDLTVEIARAHGARVVSVRLRQIAGTRNAGAREAKGEYFIFLDADTSLPEATLRAALEALRGGAVGGGARFVLDEEQGLAGRCALALFTFLYMRLCRWAAGCFVFVRRDAFERAGGFDERYYASEEIFLSRALKKEGRFELLSAPVITSARKLRMHGWGGNLRALLRLALRGRGAFRRREGLELWYGGGREAGGQRPRPGE
jgi:glycosyltransferase involved in cell wall biosynthesis